MYLSYLSKTPLLELLISCWRYRENLNFPKIEKTPTPKNPLLPRPGS
jgi:hypothetical protein